MYGDTCIFYCEKQFNSMSVPRLLEEVPNLLPYCTPYPALGVWMVSAGTSMCCVSNCSDTVRSLVVSETPPAELCPATICTSIASHLRGP